MTLTDQPVCRSRPVTASDKLDGRRVIRVYLLIVIVLLGSRSVHLLRPCRALCRIFSQRGPTLVLT